MKDSGIEWIGDVPQHWNLQKIATLYKVRNQKVSDKDFPPLSVTMKGIVPQLETTAKTNDGDNRKLVRVGDFAINSRSDRRGSCGISSYDGSVSLINTVLTPKGEMNPKYYDWLFHTVQFADEYYKCGHGIVDDLWTTTWQEMKRITIPTPPIDERKKIAEFLDKKCEEVDGLIVDIQTQIDTLEQYKRSTITEAVTKGLNPTVKMKDSGLEWVGQIPNHWEMIPNKYLMSKRKIIQPIYKGEDILSLTVNGVIKRDLENPSGKMPTSFDGYQVVYPNNLLMCLFDIDVTPRCVGVIKDYGLTSPAYSQFILNEKADTNYYYYYYLSLDFTKELLHLAKNQRHSLNEEQFGAIKAIVPPIDEQKSIAEYLDKKCAEIDACIEEKKQQISVLETYKKSIIFEYVTGKKEVK